MNKKIIVIPVPIPLSYFPGRINAAVFDQLTGIIITAENKGNFFIYPSQVISRKRIMLFVQKLLPR